MHTVLAGGQTQGNDVADGGKTSKWLVSSEEKGRRTAYHGGCYEEKMRESTFLTLLPRLVCLGGCGTTFEVEPSPRSKGRVSSPSAVDVDIPGTPIESSDVLDQDVELLAED